MKILRTINVNTAKNSTISGFYIDSPLHMDFAFSIDYLFCIDTTIMFPFPP
jgi:hypothetical protein